MLFDNIEFHNVEEIEDCGEHWCLWRLPQTVRNEINEGAANISSGYATGVELRFKMKSDSVSITLSAEAAAEANTAYIFYGSIQGGWQNSSRVILNTPTRITIQKPENLSFLKALSEENKLSFSPEVVRIVLPYGKIYYWGIEGEVEPPQKADLPSKTYLAYGSSITHGSLALAMPYSYPFRLGQKMSCDYLNLGFAGSAHMEKAMAEYIVSRKDWDFATVEMGINMLGEQHPTEVFEKNVDEFTKVLAADGRPILATSIYGFSDPKIMERGKKYRTIVEKYAKNRLFFVDGLKLLENQVYISQDMVHPSIEGMEEISRNWYSVIKNVLAKNPIYHYEKCE